MMDTNKLEQKFASKYGGKVVKNSGRGESKGDSEISYFLVDNKFTEAKSFSVNIEAFKKHERDAQRKNLLAAMVPVFMDYNERALAIVDWDSLINLIEELQYERDEFKFMYEDLCR